MGAPPRPVAQVLTFAVGGRAFAVEAAAVSEVVPAPPVTRVPQAPAGLQGVANVRGRVLPILAMDRVLDDVGPARGGRLIVLGGDHAVGLAVDAVGAMRTVDARGADAGAATELIETDEGPARLLRLEPLIAGAFDGLRPRRSEARQASQAAAATAESEDLAFLEFRISGQAYATPMDEVRAVSAVPRMLQAAPSGDAAMLGLASLRDRLLPIVSAAAVLGLPATAPDARAHVLVVAIGEVEAGLLVDEVCGVLRTRPDRVGAVPALLNRAAGEARIESVVRAGDRLVSVLPAARLLDEATIAGLLAEGAGRGLAQAAEKEEVGAMQRILLFRLGDEAYGVPIEQVEAVIRLPTSITRTPKAPPFVAGVVNHRGRVVPLVDQAVRFAAPSRPDARRRVIVASVDGLTAGFIVDAVEQIVSIPEGRLQPTPEIVAGEAGVFDRVASIEHEGRLVLVVDPRQLLDQAERDLVRAMAKTAAAT